MLLLLLHVALRPVLTPTLRATLRAACVPGSGSPSGVASPRNLPRFRFALHRLRANDTPCILRIHLSRNFRCAGPNSVVS